MPHAALSQQHSPHYHQHVHRLFHIPKRLSGCMQMQSPLLLYVISNHTCHVHQCPPRSPCLLVPATDGTVLPVARRVGRNCACGLQALIRRRVKHHGVDSLVQIKVPNPLPLSWGRAVAPYVPPDKRQQVGGPCSNRTRMRVIQF
jgi:hypothetical protein